MKAVVVESLVDGQTNASEAVDFHNVVAKVVEDVIFGEVSHHLIQQHDILVADVAPRDIIVVQRDFLIGTGATALQVNRFRHVVVGKDVVVDNCFERGWNSVGIRLDF